LGRNTNGDRLQFRSVNVFAEEILISAIATVMSSSIDASDRKQVSQLKKYRVRNIILKILLLSLEKFLMQFLKSKNIWQEVSFVLPNV
jgi:hypothetical protein